MAKTVISKNRRIILRAVLLCSAALALLFAAMGLIDHWQQNEYQEQRDDTNDAFMTSNLVTWEGEEYKQTPSVTTLLIAGIDQEANDQQGVGTSRYRNGGQADFLLLLGIDHTYKKIHQLQIDRDTMTAVTVLSVFGKETGERVMQICLAHSYGGNKEENARYTVRAVRKLMKNIDIDGYYMIDYSAVSAFNTALGGVTVTIPDDMTSVNPLWSAGSTVTLQGGEAETFVRTRKTVGEGTNAERMVRQSEFMTKALSQMRERLANDASFANELVTTLQEKSVTNLTDLQLAAEIQHLDEYEVLPIAYLEGEYTIGSSGYMEFYPTENSAESWIMQHLYTKL